MSKIEITINGKAYPCRPTMGAMLRFKKETGKEVTEITNTSLTDLCIYLHCCVASACAADGIEFGLGVQEFADALNPEDMNEWAERIQKQNTKANKAEKKR